MEERTEAVGPEVVPTAVFAHGWTRYLGVIQTAPEEVEVQLSQGDFSVFLSHAQERGLPFRYSPIFPAFPLPPPPEALPPPPTPLRSLSLVFAAAPMRTLAHLGRILREEELQAVHFSQGLASIVLVNIDLERAKFVLEEETRPELEHWPIDSGKVQLSQVVYESNRAKGESVLTPIRPQPEDTPEVHVYVEQTSASLATLWAEYLRYSTDELPTLQQVSHVVSRLCEKSRGLTSEAPGLVTAANRNAVTAALVEISAALSYAVTQGTSGGMPILQKPSPFPHHSLLGVGTSLRAVTKLVRYVEHALGARSASRVLAEQYPDVQVVLQPDIAEYASGDEFKEPAQEGEERFDIGGDYPERDHVPLLSHFSLRHGFKESKFAITAASESLTAETLPQWTLLTISHEIMHSRARDIFQILFGCKWDDERELGSWQEFHSKFAIWYKDWGRSKFPLSEALRNVVLNFCLALDRAENPTRALGSATAGLASPTDPKQLLRDFYLPHKTLAIELLVHFHDFYFTYANNTHTYLMSLWASWTKVAAPYLRPLQYLVRSLATVAVGSGLPPRPAYSAAKEALEQALASLRATGLGAPLHAEVSRLLNEEDERVRALFKVCYYLSDHYRRFFASRTIAKELDRLEEDPFSEGSTAIRTYTDNIFSYLNRPTYSPIRLVLSSFAAELSGEDVVAGAYEWLTARNAMALTSLEV